MIDLLLRGLLFIVSWFKLSKRPRPKRHLREDAFDLEDEVGRRLCEFLITGVKLPARISRQYSARQIAVIV